jgi:hypothetical protein
MPLRDHFHPPLSQARHWQALHNRWASALSDRLNELLPAGYVAEPQITVQGGVEVDTATFEGGQPPGVPPAGVAVAAPAWAPAAAPHSMPFVFPDEVEVRIFGDEGGLRLVGAVEIVSPANKKGVEDRQAFVSKCAAYLHAGVGLVVVDVVTERRANLHDALCASLGRPDATGLPQGADLYAVAYRPHRLPTGGVLDMWPFALTLGQPLPTLPLWLFQGPVLPLDLEATYTEACQRVRVA